MKMLLDIGFVRDRPNRILVQRRDFELFVGIEYENLPLCSKFCGVIGHSMIDCRQHKGGERPEQPVSKPVTRQTALRSDNEIQNIKNTHNNSVATHQTVDAGEVNIPT